jgi:hypothetical protein
VLAGLVTEPLEATVFDAVDVVAVDVAAALIGAVATGFKTVMLEELDAIEVINMALSSSMKGSFRIRLSADSAQSSRSGGFPTRSLFGGPVHCSCFPILMNSIMTLVVCCGGSYTK